MIPSSSFFSSTTPTRSDSSSRGPGDGSIRPRNRRLISTGEQELVSTSGTSTPSGSRGVSPIPQKHPSRAVSGNRLGQSVTGRQVGGVPAGDVARDRTAGGLWDGGWMGGWNALQSIASSVLGATDGGSSTPTTKGKTWGPEMLPKQNDGGIGGGTTAEREAIVRRRKMARVLEGRDEPPSAIDINGKLKHRTSLDDQRPPDSSRQDEEEDALVYIHHVQPNDTLAGVILRYNCQPAVFRKANRFWPNDSIQIRKTVILPVDACAIKGRPCDPPSPDGSGVDLLAPTPGIEEPPSLSNGKAPWPSVNATQPQRSAAPSNGVHNEGEEAWTHVRWVLLDNSPSTKPTQIARMPRKTLGYFPPRRRKSQTTMSTISTPRGSTDLSSFPALSQSPIEASRTNSRPPQARRTSSLGHRPNASITSVPGSYFPAPSMNASQTLPTRIRRDSTSRQNVWMTGPGGVGTLGPSVHAPGPAKDSMNAWVTKHLPGIAIDNLPSTYAQPTSVARLGFSSDELSSISEAPSFNSSIHQSAMVGNGVGGPGTPILGPNGLGIENAAAAVEGWIRRIAVKGVPGTPKSGPGRRLDEPDLIELLDGTGSDDGRGFDVSPSSNRIAGGGSGREDLDGLIRGRGRAGTRGKAGKSD